MKKRVISGLCSLAMIISSVTTTIIEEYPILSTGFIANAAVTNKTVSLSGYIWIDVPRGKDDKVINNLYDISANDEGYKDQDVQLINNKTGTILHTYSDENGYYRFDNISIPELSNYSIKINYDGVKYTTVNSNKDFNSSGFSYTSKGEEDSSMRNSLNTMGLNITTGKLADSNYAISASISGSFISNYYNSLSSNGKTSVSSIDFLNIGLYERSEPDLGISNDLFCAELIDDGNKYTFYYDKLDKDNLVDNELPFGVSFRRKYALRESLTYKTQDYSREVSIVSDNSISETNAIYRLSFANNSSVFGKVNSINIFYSNNIELIGVYSQPNCDISNKIGYSVTTFTNNSLSNYNCKKIIFTNPIQISKQYSTGSSISVYIKYKINSSLQEIIGKDDINTYSEISSYSVYSDDKYSTPYLGYDYDSSPNNFINTICEDDESFAPGFKVLLRTDLHGSSDTHTYTSSIIKQPTCTESGIRKYKCKCGHSYTEEIAKLGHNYTTKVVAPTESEKGYTLYTCTRCGDSYKDNYTDSLGINISKCSITLGNTSYIYDGTAKKPSVTVKYGSKTLINGTDYTVSYSNNTNVGTATVNITGKGNYTGTSTKTFVIQPKPTEKKTFEWGRDNWNFINSDYAYYSNRGFTGGTNRDHISTSYLNKLLDQASNKETRRIENMLDKDWAGSCFGMTSVIILANNGLLPYNNYTSGATNTFNLDKPLNNEKIDSLITYYLLTQKLDYAQQRFSYYYTTESNKPELQMKRIIAEIDKFGMANICDFNHSLLAYDYSYGSWRWNGVTYGGCIYLCDPNCSDHFNEEYCLYFNTNTYNWIIPHYGARKSSVNGDYIDFVVGDPETLNTCGYLNGNSKSSIDSYYGSLTANLVAENHSVSKVSRGKNGYTKTASNEDDIISCLRPNSISGDDDEVLNYILRDAKSSYILSQTNPEPLDLTMDYEECLLEASSKAGKSIIFDNDGYVEVNGESADYTIAMTYNESYPTDWYSIEVNGSNANTASLEMVDNGWIISADCLESVVVNTNNKEVEATTSFSTEYTSAFIYEIDKNTIGIRVDSDNNGTYETDIGDTKVLTGDIDGNGKLNMKDYAKLQQYLNDNTITIDKKAADVNADGKINMKDYALLQQKLNGWEV